MFNLMFTLWVIPFCAYCVIYGALITHRAIQSGNKPSTDYLIGFVFIILGVALISLICLGENSIL